MPSRRTALRALAGGLAALGGCAGGDVPIAGSNWSEATTRPTTATTETATEEPTETTEEQPETTERSDDALCGERWEPEVRWSVSTGVRAYAPTVADGVVYFGSQNGHLYAVDAATGDVAWRAEHRGALGGTPPAVHDGAVAYSGHERVTAFDAADGTERWSFTAPGSLGDLSRSVADDGDAVYVGAFQHPGPNQALQEGEREYDRVYAFDHRTGDRRWRVSLDDRLDGDRTPPEEVAAANGRVFALVDRGPLVALDARDGTTLWRHDGPESRGRPVAVGDAVYQSTRHGLLALDAATGDERWTATAERSPAVADDAVYAADGGVLRAFDPADGSRLWRAEVPDGSGRTPAVADDTVYLPARRADAGRLYAFDADTGCLRGTFDVRSRTPSTPAVANGTVYVGGLNGEGRMWAVAAP